MALNFPANTNFPYVDPISGLKYIYNPAVGAWEAAIQPPAVISSDPPALSIPGFLWWDDVSGSLYIWYQDADGGQWVDATPVGSSISTAQISENPPEDPLVGEMWWNSEDGRLYIYYDDGNSKQWIQATTGSSGSSVVNYGVKCTAGTGQPSTPRLHDLWYNTNDKSLYLYLRSENGSGGVWTKANDVRDRGSYVNNVSVSGSLSLGGTPTDPVITAEDATTTNSGAIKIATVTEAVNAVSKTDALTPAVLKEAIQLSPGEYLPPASTSKEGVVSLASKDEVVAGTAADKAVTPLTLKQSIPELVVQAPVGSIIEYGGDYAPTGYLKCNGGDVNRSTYRGLFQVIGTKFGIGDGVSTFNLPNLPTSSNTIKCIKF